jgi:hypothetical protein
VKFGTQEKKIQLAPFKIQNGGEIQDARQTIKCSRFVKNDSNYLQLWILEDYTIKKYHTTIFFFNLQNG